MEKINLELTVDEANQILAALGQQPYLKVVDLIQKIQGQGAVQLNGQRSAAAIDQDILEVESLAGVSNGQ